MKQKLINNSIFTVIGICIGCAIMSISHNDMYQHFYRCQEKQLIDSICNILEEREWYIKEDAHGKLKLINLSKKELLDLETQMK